jgi:hypothetical protein
VRILRRLVSACAVVALVLACVAGDPQGPLSGDDTTDDASSVLDLSRVLPAARTEPQLALAPSGPVFVDQQIPNARLTTLEIFRPPRAVA